MTGGFSFPPPPPPPPRATTSVQPEFFAQEQHRGGRGGRGGRGRGKSRGRGGQRGGRPDQQYQQNGYGQNFQSSNSQSGYTDHGANQQPAYSTGVYQQPYNLPAGSYINPAFAATLNAQSHQNPNMQTLGYPGQGSRTTSSSPDFSNGQKRTREQAFGHNSKHPMKKPPSVPRTQAAPAVPSFGAPLPVAAPIPTTIQSVNSSATPAKARPKSLGLVPTSYGSDDSGASDGEDEEAALAATLSSGPLTFEFNGETATLSSSADIAAWVAERKKRWPSARRVQEKKEEVRCRMEERRRIEEETRMANLAGRVQPVTKRHEVAKPKQAKQQQPPQQVERLVADPLAEARRELELQMQKVQELQQRLAESEKRAPTTSAPEETTARNSAEIPTTSIEKSPLNSMLDALNAQSTNANTSLQLPTATIPPTTDAPPPSSPDRSTPDSAPENLSSKPSAPIRISPPPRPAQKACTAFTSTGRCKFSTRCRFKHEQSAQQQQRARKEESRTGGKGRTTLYERLMEKEREEEDQLVLKAVRHLGGVGFFSRSVE